jgi:putative transposase
MLNVGARIAPACTDLNINVRTYERWVSKGGIKENQRPLAARPVPKNKLTKEERQGVLDVVKKE